MEKISKCDEQTDVRTSYKHVPLNKKMRNFMLNNFVLHNELPISQRLAIKRDGHLLNNFSLHNELPILHQKKVFGLWNEKSGKKNLTQGQKVVSWPWHSLRDARVKISINYELTIFQPKYKLSAVFSLSQFAIQMGFGGKTWKRNDGLGILGDDLCLPYKRSYWTSFRLTFVMLYRSNGKSF